MTGPSPSRESTYPDRIAMCQAEGGPHEHVPLAPGEVPGACFMDCDCKPRVYVALDTVEAALLQAQDDRQSIDNLGREVSRLRTALTTIYTVLAENTGSVSPGVSLTLEGVARSALRMERAE